MEKEVFTFLVQFFLMLFLLFLQRISKHQLKSWTIAAVKKKEMVNKIVAEVIVALFIQFDYLALMLYFVYVIEITPKFL
jgi:hypothetical protein